jgi:hypothetical protein
MRRGPSEIQSSDDRCIPNGRDRVSDWTRKTRSCTLFGRVATEWDQFWTKRRAGNSPKMTFSRASALVANLPTTTAFDLPNMEPRFCGHSSLALLL